MIGAYYIDAAVAPKRGRPLELVRFWGRSRSRIPL